MAMTYPRRCDSCSRNASLSMRIMSNTDWKQKDTDLTLTDSARHWLSFVPIKKTGCSGNDAYNIQLFWDFSNDELDYVINHCPDEFNRLELTAFYERIEVMRASEEWQRAGAYSVRIQGMNRQHHISLRDEFDEYDKDGTRYIVILYDGYPVATCRFYEVDPETVIMGRVVVLPEYRNRFLGTRVIGSAEKWIKELKYKEILIDARLEVVSFYEKLGYIHMDDSIKKSGNFECIRMHKYI